MERPCPICSNGEKTLLYRQNFGSKTIAVMESYDVVACKSCGFTYADNIPPQAEFNNYYAIMSKYEFDHNDGVVAKDYVKHFTKIFDFLAAHITNKNARILDMGCSTGCLLSLFKQNGYHNLLGVDPSSSCVRTVSELYGIEAAISNISDFNDNEKFDVIILSAVLEHLVDFDGAVRKLRSLLKDGGLFFIEIPDAERFYSFIITPYQQFSIEHINYFSQYSAVNLLSKFAFEVIEIKQSENRINQTTDPDIFILSRKLDKNDFKIVRDDISEVRLKNYIFECAKIGLKVDKIIQRVFSNNGKIIVWGVGTHTQRLIGSGLDLSKVLFFVDSNIRYKGKNINGIEIKSPGDVKEEVPILISTYSYQEEVASQIKDVLKLKNEIIKIY